MDIGSLHLHWGGGKYKGKQYKSYYLAKSVRKNGKNNHKPIIKLGKLSGEEVKWWKNLLTMLKNPSSIVTTLEDIITRKHYSYCELAVVNKFWNYWNLDDVFLYERGSDISLSSIAKILTVNRCICPESKSGVVEWFKCTALPQMMNIEYDKVNKSRIFRDLPYIEKNKERICRHLLEEYKKQCEGSLERVYYDLSSTVFSGSKCIISKYGHCKEGFRTHVVLALLVTQEGLPFYWEVLPGGTADAKTIKWLLKRCKNKFKDLNITVVFDRGFVSDKNLREFEKEGIKYISAMDRNQVLNICKDQINFSKFSDFTINNIKTSIKGEASFTEMNSTVYYREIKVENGRRYILCFNPELFIDQRQTRDKAIDAFKNKVLPELNEQLRCAKKNRAYDITYTKLKKSMSKYKINSFTELELLPLVINRNGRTIHTFQGKIRINQEKKKEISKMDGFWLLITNLSEKDDNKKFIISPEEVLQPYRDKIIIEDAFRDIKSFIEIAPIYVWLEEHIKAHYTICVLSYLINRTITNLLKKNKGSFSNDILTHVSVYKELANCSIDEIYIKNIDTSNFCITELSKKQKDILQRLQAMEVTKLDTLLNKFRKNITEHN